MLATDVAHTRDDLDRLQEPQDPAVVLQQLVETLTGHRLRLIVQHQPSDRQRPGRLDPRAVAVERCRVKAESDEVRKGAQAAQRASPASVDREIGHFGRDRCDALEQIVTCQPVSSTAAFRTY